MKLSKLFFLFSVICSAVSLYAAGFSILEQSPAGMGRALAGMTADTTEPTALYFNPSATAWFDHAAIVGGMHILTGNCRFHDTGHSTMDGGKSGDFIGTSYIPNLAVVVPLEDGFVANFTMSATSGTETNYPWDWMGRYFARDTSVAVIEFQPSMAYRVSDTFAVAVGLMVQYASLEMRQALDRPDAALPARDTRLKLEGDTWTTGFTLGMTWKALEHTTLGLGYRSPMRHQVDCKSKVTNGYAAIYDPILGDRADISLTMPQSVNFGVVQELSKAWKIMADLSWTDWSVMDEMKVKFKTGQTTSEKMKWHDNWRVAIGTEYMLTEKWTLRCGAAFDERPVTKHDNKTFKLPDSNRYWLSTGVSYQYNKNLRLDFALTHIFFQPSTICQTHSDGRYVKGKVTGYTNLVSLGARYDF